jgi:hypothetical protein
MRGLVAKDLCSLVLLFAVCAYPLAMQLHAFFISARPATLPSNSRVLLPLSLGSCHYWRFTPLCACSGASRVWSLTLIRVMTCDDD